MVSLFSLIGYLLPQASDCYLKPNMIDPAISPELRAISHDVADENNAAFEEVYSKLNCTSFTKKEKTFVRKVTGTSTPLASKYVEFRDRLVTEARIAKGATFYKKHKTVLEKAASHYNVDPYIITAIMGSETIYGEFLGKGVLREALVDVVINEPSNDKQAYFTRQLKTLLKLSLSGKLDVKTTSSWDGGIGLSQFMPSSYERYAVSFKNKAPNLFDVEDAAYSIANYLSQHGFKKEGYVTRKLEEVDSNIPFKDGSKIETNYVNGRAIANKDEPCIYKVALQNGESEYWERGPNFYAITTYNPRPFYVISIHQLAEAIHDRVNA